MISKFTLGVRSTIIDPIERQLYNNPRQHLHKQLIELIETNSSIYRNNVKTLSYNGEIYSYTSTPNHDQPANLLHRKVRPQFKLWLQERDEMNHERDLVLGYIHRLMMFTGNYADFKLLLPESLHGALAKVSRFFLHNAESMTAFAIQDFKIMNEPYIGLMRERMVTNLIDPA